MDTLNISSEQADKKSQAGSGILSVVVPVAALLLAAYATTVAISFGIPDDTDYAKASILKHDKLASDKGKKIVLVGGSNLSYGVDSTVLKEATHCPVVNMGMNGYFGVRYMLEEVKPDLHEGDIVVIAWEYDSFYKSVDGTSTDLLMVTKTNPAAFRFLSTDQVLGVLGSYPYVAQQKLLRVGRDAMDGITQLLGGEPRNNDTAWVEAVEGYASFTPDGDLSGHIGRTWDEEVSEGLDMSALPMDENVLPLMEAFVKEMNARGVKVMVSWSPLADTFYEKHKAAVEQLSAQMMAIPEFRIVRPAHDYVFPISQHFDTVFHLNAEGRPIRSRMLADDILTEFGDDAICTSTP
jgi:hypothetical protein